VQLRLAHHAPQPEQEAVVVVGGVVDAVRVGAERAPQRAQVQKRVPVGVVARQPTRFVGEDYADVAQRHLARELPETLPAVGALSREPKVGVDHTHPPGAPSQIHRPPGERLLVLLALRIPLHLLRGGLAHVDVGRAL